MSQEDTKIFVKNAGAILKALRNGGDVSDEQVQELWDTVGDGLDEEDDKQAFIFFTGLKDYLSESPAGTQLTDLENIYSELVLESLRPQ